MVTSHRQRLSRAVTITIAAAFLASCGSDAATTTASSAPSASSTPAATTQDVTTDAPVASAAPSTAADTVAPPDSVADTTPATNDEAAAATRALFASITPDTPGCSVAVARDGKVIFNESYGAATLNPTVPLTNDNSFDIGSTSKQFTATSVQLLVDQGLVDWNAPLSTYFPEFPEWASTVTMLQVAHHTSGIPDYINTLAESGVAFETKVTNEEMLAAIASNEAVEFEPGSSWAYSNSNYVLLGALIERITSNTLATFMETNIFPAAGMIAEWDDGNPIAGQAASYERATEAEPWTELKWQWPQLGDGGVIATSAQVALWGSQYFAPTIGTVEINAQRVADAAPMEFDGKELGKYGLGIMERNVDGLGRVLEHSGGWEAYVTNFAVSPDNRVVVASTCLSAEGPTATNPTLGDDLLKAWV
jgi:CubicO group peptidase (beta-lactamase class C family)